MRIQRSSRQGCVVLTLAGRLDVAAAPQLQRVILRQLAERPPAIICDLGQVEETDPLCARVFIAIRHPNRWQGNRDRPGSNSPLTITTALRLHPATCTSYIAVLKRISGRG